MYNNFIKNIDEDLLNNWNELIFFNLTGNKWRCDCHLTYVIDFILPLTIKFRDDKMRLMYTDHNMR